ncbi:MAG: class I SAM-dependent methyltransferase [Kiritimatiellae bacterium]|nr:class I SAM-dependent methyltransferase [Kiritimatiellia bacterium]
MARRLQSTNAAAARKHGEAAGEQTFHDRWAAALTPAEVMVDASWEAATCPEHRWIRSRIGTIAGQRVLDLGCGAGEGAVWLAKQGARVVACDLSSRFLRLAAAVARAHAVGIETCEAAAAALPFAEGSFDLVYAGNVLHHTALLPALDEVRRVLKAGGQFVSWDPLLHNPLIKIYRRMAGRVRTRHEQPLRMAVLAEFRARFADVRYECFWFLALWLFVRFYLIERVHPATQRYWKKIIAEHERLAPGYRRLERWDRRLLRLCPWLKRFCWNIAISARKSGQTAG